MGAKPPDNEEAPATWAVEEIPDPDTLFRRAHRSQLSEGITAACFEPHGPPGLKGISIDWSRHRSAAESRHGHLKKPASEFGVLQVVARTVRDIVGLELEHTPRPNNRAHSDVWGADHSGAKGAALEAEKIRCTDLREQLAHGAQVAIRPDDPVEPQTASE